MDTLSLMDDAVFEVFALMVGLPCIVDECPLESAQVEAMQAVAGGGETITTQSIAASHREASDHLTAIVGFVGVMNGTCVVRVSAAGARCMTGCMLGAALHEVDTCVADAFAEVCNMVAGGWKSRLPALDSGCMLSVPAVLRGCIHHLHAPASTIHMDRLYRFDGHRMRLTLLCDPALRLIPSDR